MYYLDAKRLAAEAIQRAERAEQQIEELKKQQS